MEFVESKLNRTLLVPSCAQSAREILRKWPRDSKYYLGTILYQIPVIVSDDAAVIGDAAHDYSAFHDVQFFTAQYDSDFPFAVISRKEDPELWYLEFDNFTLHEFQKDFLTFFPYLRNLFRHRFFRLDEMPTAREWEAIRFCFYVLARRIPVFPVKYPAYLSLKGTALDFSLVDRQIQRGKNPWTGENSMC